MAPSTLDRQLCLMWLVPITAALFGYWYNKRRIGPGSSVGQGGIDPTISTRVPDPASSSNSVSAATTTTATTATTNTAAAAATEKLMSATSQEGVNVSPPAVKGIPYSRSLSGVDSAPIDIKSSRSPPVVISDTELDLEIEKIKSMKNKTSPPVMTSRKSYKDDMVVSSSTERTRTHSSDSGGDRDSANHSPALPANSSCCPSPNSITDNSGSHSSRSSDSGKGGSEVATPPPPAQQQQTNVTTTTTTTNDGDTGSEATVSSVAVYEFVIPQQLVGRLIGRQGSFVHQIKEKTNAHILIKKHPDSMKLKICAVEGTADEIDAALMIIRDKFPEKRYPEVTLERVSFVPVVPDCMHLRLVEGVNNDTIVSCMVTPSHLFLQQPTHPTFPSLNVLSSYMNACYTDPTITSPALPTPVPLNTICAAYSAGSWYRASVVSTDPESDTSTIKFLDFGGFATVPNSSLRQIRGDFLLLPFQAAECHLANIEPISICDETEEEEDQCVCWTQDAYDAVAELTRGAVVITQLVDYLCEDDSTPLVHIYVRSADGRRVTFLNRELVERGLARWTELPRELV